MSGKQYHGKNGGDRSRSPRSDNWRRRSGAGSGERQAEPADLSVKPSSRATQLSTPPSRGQYRAPRSPPRHDSSQGPRHRTTQLPTPPWQSNGIRAGDVVWLPSMATGDHSPSERLRRQPWLNHRAPNHFVVVWDVYVENGEPIARCLQMTSFEGKLVETKYPYVNGNAWKFRLQYVPIQQGRAPTASSVNMPSLELEDGMSMPKQTYAHLDHYFDIEAKFLERRGGRRLTQRTLCVLTYKLEEWIDERIWRKIPREVKDIWSPLDYDFKPRFRGEVLSRAHWGFEEEKHRLDAMRMHRWTGNEPRHHHPAR
jgi:hypothetical protein